MRKTTVFIGQNFLTVASAIMVLWWCFGGFTFAFNGAIADLLGGRVNILLFLIFIILYIIGKKNNPWMFKNGERKLATAFVAVNAGIYITSFMIGGALIPGDFVIFAFIGWAILTYNEESRAKVFDAFLIIMITLWCLSILEFLIYALIGKGIIVGMVERRFDATSGNTQVFVQTLFNLIRIDQNLPRFQSLFEEPGGLGNVASLLLFLTGNNSRYRFAHIITWLAGIFSFSLGFYMLAATYLLGQTIRIKYLVVAGFVVAIFANTTLFMEYYDNLIVSRVEGKSLEEIDNRSSNELDIAMENSFKKGTIWLGNGGMLPKSFQYFGGVSGGKPFVYKYGVLFTILTLGLYIIVFLKKAKKNKMAYRKQVMFILFFLLSFYKSAVLFMPFYVLMFFLYPYYYSLADIQNNKKLINKKIYVKQEFQGAI